MKIKTLSKIPFLISWIISIPLFSFLLRLSRNFSAIESSNTEYIIVLVSFTLTSIILTKLFTGELIVNINDEKERIEIKWNKKPILTNIENQIVNVTRIKEFKKYNSKITNGLNILLLNGEKINIDFNNLVNFRKNSEKRELIINYLNSRNINCI